MSGLSSMLGLSTPEKGRYKLRRPMLQGGMDLEEYLRYREQYSEDELNRFFATFSRIDLDKDGKINAFELGKLLEELGYSGTFPEVLISKVNKDSSRFLSFGGFLEVLKSLEFSTTKPAGTPSGRFHYFTKEEISSLVNFINTILKGREEEDDSLSHQLPLDPFLSSSLFSVAEDGVLFCKLLQILAPSSIDPSLVHWKPKNLFEKRDNHHLALDATDNLGLERLGISPVDLSKGTPHLILSFLNLLYRYWIQKTQTKERKLIGPEESRKLLQDLMEKLNLGDENGFREILGKIPQENVSKVISDLRRELEKELDIPEKREAEGKSVEEKYEITVEKEIISTFPETTETKFLETKERDKTDFKDKKYKKEKKDKKKKEEEKEKRMVEDVLGDLSEEEREEALKSGRRMKIERDEKMKYVLEKITFLDNFFASLHEDYSPDLFKTEKLLLSAEVMLLLWFNKHIFPLTKDIVVTNFTTDLQDGRYYTLLLHSLYPSLCSLDPLKESDSYLRARMVLLHIERVGIRLEPAVTARELSFGDGVANFKLVSGIYRQWHVNSLLRLIDEEDEGRAIKERETEGKRARKRAKKEERMRRLNQLEREREVFDLERARSKALLEREMEENKRRIQDMEDKLNTHLMKLEQERGERGRLSQLVNDKEIEIRNLQSQLLGSRDKIEDLEHNYKSLLRKAEDRESFLEERLLEAEKGKVREVELVNLKDNMERLELQVEETGRENMVFRTLYISKDDILTNSFVDIAVQDLLPRADVSGYVLVAEKRNWKLRFMVLKDTTLFFFNSEKGTHPLFTFCLTASYVSLSKVEKEGEKYVFSLQRSLGETHGTTVTVGFVKEENCLIWLSRIRAVRERYRGLIEDKLIAIETLHQASAVGNLSAVQQLLRSGMRISQKNKWGETCLHAAASYGQLHILDYFINYLHTHLTQEGIKDVLNAQTFIQKRTALHYGAQKGFTEVCRVLMRAGIDPLLKDYEGHTAEDLAFSRFTDTAEILTSRRL